MAPSHLLDVRSEWDGYDPLHAGCVAKGRDLIVNMPGLYLPASMAASGTWPIRPIVLDNRSPIDETADLPQGLVLIEGHLRFNIAAYLLSVGRFAQRHSVWLMRAIEK